MEKLEKYSAFNSFTINNTEMNKIYGGRRVRTGADPENGSRGDVQKYKHGELVWTKIYY